MKVEFGLKGVVTMIKKYTALKNVAKKNIKRR